MIKRFIKAFIVSSIMIILPVLGNLEMLRSPQLLILLIIGIIASIFQPDYRIVVDKSNSRDNNTEIQIIWSVYIILLLTICEATYLRFPESVYWNIFTTVSLIAIILGLVLRSWAIYTLGKFFTMNLSIQNNHRIICTGPYKYLRHPSYLGAFFVYIGIPIFLHSWFSLLVAAVILPMAWFRRIHYEEKMLIEEFGEEYLSYCKSVKRIIPGLW
ncbi:MAG: isoprenylcysteine carboxylmethyltransferase family protein [Cyanobacteriota bacterium]